jgi:elongator complex protein 3
MPNLPGSNLKKDEKMFEELFQNSDFQPDLLKIYPCALLKEAPLYKLWKIGKYGPYTQSQLINLIKSIKKKIPYYVRIQRITRDIPSQKIAAGAAKISNLRQILAEDMKKGKWGCKCIRCREIREKYNPREKIYLFRQNYAASDGKEIFLSFENKNRAKLYSLLRLRITSQNEAIIREIHTYGRLVPISEIKIAPQHQGLGKKLIKEAEKIAKNEFGLRKIAVISAIGVRNYFRKLGYKLSNTYMVKNI